MYHQRLGIREVERDPIWLVCDDFGNLKHINTLSLIALGNEVACNKTEEWKNLEANIAIAKFYAKM
jgi:hypothetical protein